jgi:predicted anti-sigma-YlaC factor YlaD
MNNCEQIEAHISAWLDQELDRAEQIELLDHLARCETCREFYLEARALDGMVAAFRTPKAAPAPPPRVWERIESRIRGEQEASTVRWKVPAWAWRVSAAIVVAVGLGAMYWLNGGAVAPPPADAEIQLGAGPMTDERFVELTREVLGADPRYHTALYQVMDQVIQETRPREASAELASPRMEFGSYSRTSDETGGEETAFPSPV